MSAEIIASLSTDLRERMIRPVLGVYQPEKSWGKVQVLWAGKTLPHTLWLTHNWGTYSAFLPHTVSPKPSSAQRPQPQSCQAPAVPPARPPNVPQLLPSHRTTVGCWRLWDLYHHQTQLWKCPVCLKIIREGWQTGSTPLEKQARNDSINNSYSCECE